MGEIETGTLNFFKKIENRKRNGKLRKKIRMRKLNFLLEKAARICSRWIHISSDTMLRNMTSMKNREKAMKNFVLTTVNNHTK
jgi:hypothetical protein